MNPRDNMSPEEKLLRLIRKGNGSERKNAQAETASERIKRGKSINFLKLIFGAVGVEGNANQSIPVGKISGIKYLNRIFLVISCVLLGIFFLTFLFRSHEDKDNPPTKNNISLAAENFGKDFTRPYNEYANGTLDKEMFGSISPTASTGAASTQTKENLNELLKDLTLIGIVAEEQPQAIIEDKKNVKTYFLKKGDSLGKLKLVEISDNEGKVIFESEGERVELYL